MKKILLSIAILLTSATISFAQSAITPGTNLLSVGIGVGSPYFGESYSSSFPVNPTISFERGIVIDNLAVGAEASFATSKYSFDGFTSTFTAVYIGVRGTYHFGQLLSIPSQFDLYGGATAGFIIETASDNFGGSPSASSGPGGGGFVGGKYYFAPKIGVYAEAGFTSLSFVNVGVTFKL